jgi:TPR repeat protein
MFVLYLALGIATVGQAVSPAPQSQPPQKEEIHPSRLSSAEVSQLQATAEAGDASAQASLARAYEDGNGVPQNDKLAFQWYSKAAEQGDAEAANSVGVMYRLGQGIGSSKEDAVVWYHKAARLKNPKAMFNLGAAYYNGDGVGVDDVISYAWFLLAHEAGSPAAEEALRRAGSEKGADPTAAYARVGQMYETGEEIPKDSQQALKWYRKAADERDASSAVAVASLLLAVGRSPTQEEYSESRKRCEDAAKRNFAPGAYCEALIYGRGLGGTKDPVERAKWLTRAAELGHARAVLELGEAYWKGEGVKLDPVAAYTWIWLAYNSKVPGAEQDEQALRKELTAKQVEQAKRKATEWSIQHRSPLRLRQR